MIFKGFRFGLLLQLAVGPLCLYILNTVLEYGFLQAFFGVMGVVLMDGIYIALSIIGITALVKNHQSLLKSGGTIILLFFGGYTIWSALFSGPSSPGLISSGAFGETFLSTVILTGANPLTIIFWSGVFSAKIIEDHFSRKDEILFGIGAVLSTLIALSFVAFVGQFTSQFIGPRVIMILNIVVGLILIFFGFKLFYNRNKA